MTQTSGAHISGSELTEQPDAMRRSSLSSMR